MTMPTLDLKVDTAQQILAVNWFLDVWFRDTLLIDLADRLSCTEVDALVDLLSSQGYAHAYTEAILEAHSGADDEGDGHYRYWERNVDKPTHTEIPRT